MDNATRKILEIVTDVQDRVVRIEGDISFIERHIGLKV